MAACKCAAVDELASEEDCIRAKGGDVWAAGLWMQYVRPWHVLWALRLSKDPGELVRAAALSSFNRTRRRVRRIRGNVFRGELAPRRRNYFIAVSAPGNAQHFSGNCEGVEVAGELAPPSTSLFDKLCAHGMCHGSYIMPGRQRKQIAQPNLHDALQIHRQRRTPGKTCASCPANAPPPLEKCPRECYTTICEQMFD